MDWSGHPVSRKRSKDSMSTRWRQWLLETSTEKQNLRTGSNVVHKPNSAQPVTFMWSIRAYKAHQPAGKYFSYDHAYYNNFSSFLCSVRTAEFCLPLVYLDEALGEVIEIANHYAKKFKQYSLLPIYVRLAKTDDLYLSPANGKCAVDGSEYEHVCYIEVGTLHKNITINNCCSGKLHKHWLTIVQFSIERIWSNYMQPAPSAGKCTRATSRLVFVLRLIGWKWREFFQPITERSKAKPKQTRITFDSQLNFSFDLTATFSLEFTKQTNLLRYQSNHDDNPVLAVNADCMILGIRTLRHL